MLENQLLHMCVLPWKWVQPLFGPERIECLTSWEGWEYAPLGIQQAESAFSAHFWWLSALSKRNRPWAHPFVRPLKISMAHSTWLSRSLAENQPSQFFPGLKTMHTSLKNDENLEVKNRWRHTCHHHADGPSLLSRSQRSWGTGPLLLVLEPHFCSYAPTKYSVCHFEKTLMQKCTMILLTMPKQAGDLVDCTSLHCEVHAWP